VLDFPCMTACILCHNEIKKNLHQRFEINLVTPNIPLLRSRVLLGELCRDCALSIAGDAIEKIEEEEAIARAIK
jgi:hypothetical protein